LNLVIIIIIIIIFFNWQRGPLGTAHGGLMIPSSWLLEKQGYLIMEKKVVDRRIVVDKVAAGMHLLEIHGLG